MNNIFEEDYNKLEEYTHIYYHPRFFAELGKLLKGYSKVEKFNSWFSDKMALLDEKHSKDLIMEYPKSYEPIKKEKDIYCITYRHGEKNIRILFQITTINDSVNILLKAFDEKNTKADYDIAKEVVRKRKFKQK